VIEEDIHGHAETPVGQELVGHAVKVGSGRYTRGGKRHILGIATECDQIVQIGLAPGRYRHYSGRPTATSGRATRRAEGSRDAAKLLRASADSNQDALRELCSGPPRRLRGANERKGKAIKVYCHLCGATLRSGDQYQQLDSLSHQDVVYVCRDERRCELRAAQNPLTGKPYQDPPGKAHTAQQTPTRTLV
jgi:hypothetical protein